jgi:hypothetical protein
VNFGDDDQNYTFLSKLLEDKQQAVPILEQFHSSRAIEKPEPTSSSAIAISDFG